MKFAKLIDRIAEDTVRKMEQSDITDGRALREALAQAIGENMYFVSFSESFGLSERRSLGSNYVGYFINRACHKFASHLAEKGFFSQQFEQNGYNQIVKVTFPMLKIEPSDEVTPELQV